MKNLKNGFVLVNDIDKYRKIYHKDKEKQETTISRIEYAKVIFNIERIETLYEFEGEYVITLKSGRMIQVSKEDFEDVKSLC